MMTLCLRPKGSSKCTESPICSWPTRSGKCAYDPRKPQIKILNVQSSKGLEFHSVIGLGQIETSENQPAQNMKLLYVEMSRANERRMITASGTNEFTEKLAGMTGVVCAVA